MDRNRIRDILLAGFERFYDEGMHSWNRRQVKGAINPRGESNDLESPEIQDLLNELEHEGVIRLVREDARYLDVLKPKRTGA